MSRRPMTGSEGRASVEQATANIARHGYDQFEIGSAKRSERRVCRACYASRRWPPPLRMERNRAHEMKDASARTSLEPTVNVAHLAAAITTAASMDIREKECVCDRI